MNTPCKPVGWFEIYVADMPRARAFYEATLNIKLEPLPSPSEEEGMEMWMFPDAMDQTKPGCSGALCKMKDYQPGGGGTLLYFICEDCAVESGRAAAHGGKIYKEKMSIGQYGFIAIVADSEGNTIGLHSMK
ncbi:MAG: VOC family protein [Blastochloris sp.]|nr:VOC family protein [Blastochloris sp.]